MIRINLYVTETQDKWLEEQAKKMEIGKSELIRRIMDKAKEGKIKYVKKSSD